VSQEDAEDCFDAAVEGLLKRDSGQVGDPYNYVFTSAKNAALDLLRERKLLVRYDPEWEGNTDDLNGDDGGGPMGPPPEWFTESLRVIAEAVLEVEISARDEQLRAAFGITLLKLAPNRRRLVEILLDRGTDITNAALADLMGRSETALKSLKSRTFGDLRELLPVAAHELGINLDDLLAPPPEISFRRPALPSSDEDIEPVV
jgi:DNA-directed RNA polymerase specialized sigma24 family protein